MANTYTQIYIRCAQQEAKADHYQQVPDHVHILIGMKPGIALSDLVKDIKANSSRFINERKWVRGRYNGKKAHFPIRTHS